VPTKEEIVIKDACVLFDLLDLNLMEEFYKLDLIVYTTPQVIAEVTDEDQLSKVNVYIQSMKLKIDGNGLVDDVQFISDEYPGLSFADSSVIELAIRKNCTVLSSDNTLRKISVKKKLIVHGMVWIIEELHRCEIISSENAIEKLRSYPEINQRAPKKEIDELIRKLTSE